MSWIDECDLEYLIGDLKDENAKLRNEVELTKRMYAKVSEDLCAEQADNERLRQELAICEESEQEKCIEYLRQENIDWEDRYRELAKENAKLHELANAVKEFIEDVNCSECPMMGDCDDNNVIACHGELSFHAFHAMYKLGIEVE